MSARRDGKAPDHSRDDWYIDSGMGGPKIRVQNGGLQRSWYVPEAELKYARFPEMVAREFLRKCDADWKRECAERYGR